MVLDQQVYNNDDNDAQINSVSCVTAVTCYAVDNQGDILATTSEKSWSVVNNADSGTSLAAISCATASFCVAIDSSDAIVRNDGGWNDPVTVDSNNQLNDVSCPTTTFCVAVDSNGEGYLFNGSITRWSAVSIESNRRQPDRGVLPEPELLRRGG